MAGRHYTVMAGRRYTVMAGPDPAISRGTALEELSDQAWP
jgi:hypothetical protein